MCFYDQNLFQCGDYKWGNFRLHCNREYRTGEPCGMKLVFSTYAIREKCRICLKIETKQRRIEMESNRIKRWRAGALMGGCRFEASVETSNVVVRELLRECTELSEIRMNKKRVVDGPWELATTTWDEPDSGALMPMKDLGCEDNSVRPDSEHSICLNTKSAPVLLRASDHVALEQGLSPLKEQVSYKNFHLPSTSSIPEELAMPEKENNPTSEIHDPSLTSDVDLSAHFLEAKAEVLEERGTRLDNINMSSRTTFNQLYGPVANSEIIFGSDISTRRLFMREVLIQGRQIMDVGNYVQADKFLTSALRFHDKPMKSLLNPRKVKNHAQATGKLAKIRGNQGHSNQAAGTWNPLYTRDDTEAAHSVYTTQGLGKGFGLMYETVALLAQARKQRKQFELALGFWSPHCLLTLIEQEIFIWLRTPIDLDGKKVTGFYVESVKASGSRDKNERYSPRHPTKFLGETKENDSLCAPEPMTNSGFNKAIFQGIRTRGNNGSQSNSSSSQSSTSESGAVRSSRSIGKRRMQDRDSPPPDDNGGKRHKDIIPLERKTSLYTRPLACPFHKNNPRKYSANDTTAAVYRTCAGPGFQKVSDVKQHLRRKHQPDQCRRCWRLFEIPEELDQHSSSEIACEKRDQEPEGVDRAKMKRISAWGVSWEGIYEILFPDAPVPSPYFEEIEYHEPSTAVPQAGSQTLAIFEAYNRTALPLLVEATLRAGIDAEISTEKEAWVAEITNVVKRCQSMVADNYQNMKARPSGPIISGVVSSQAIPSTTFDREPIIDTSTSDQSDATESVTVILRNSSSLNQDFSTSELPSSSSSQASTIGGDNNAKSMLSGYVDTTTGCLCSCHAQEGLAEEEILVGSSGAFAERFDDQISSPCEVCRLAFCDWYFALVRFDG